MADLSRETREYLISWFHHDSTHLIRAILIYCEGLERDLQTDSRKTELISRIKQSTHEIEFFSSIFIEILPDRDMVPTRFSHDLMAPIIDRIRRGRVNMTRSIIAPGIRGAPPVLLRPELARLGLFLLLNRHAHIVHADASISGNTCESRLKLEEFERIYSRTVSELLIAAGFEVEFRLDTCALTAILAPEEAAE